MMIYVRAVSLVVTVFLLSTLPSEAQTPLNTANKYFCSERKIYLLSRGNLRLQKSASVVKAQKALLKKLNSQLKRAKGSAKTKISNQIKLTKDLITNVPRCLRGDFDAPVSVEPTMSLGDLHSCAISNNGTLKCWGDDLSDQLGNGPDATAKNTPQSVSSSAKFKAVTGGETFSCAVTVAGAVQCWGRNVFGQLGDGSTTSQAAPVQVVGLVSGVTAVTAGDRHACALLNDGTVKCWGDNSDGQLGTSSNVQSKIPVAVTGLTGVQSVEAGPYHTCAVVQGGALRCWGYNTSGQLGDGSKTSRSAPVNVIGLASGVVRVSAGGPNTCAAMSDGTVKCWGAGGAQLGQEVGADSETPLDIAGITGATEVAVGNGFACAVIAAGEVKCWGTGNDGRLGNGAAAGSSAPVSVATLSNASTLRLGDSHACVIVGGNQGQCWGLNSRGQLGHGSSVASSTTPVVVSGFPLS
jgi:alpha-tubulin suppressor-like RCC1 family protein